MHHVLQTKDSFISGDLSSSLFKIKSKHIKRHSNKLVRTPTDKPDENVCCVHVTVRDDCQTLFLYDVCHHIFHFRCHRFVAHIQV
jgi:hypothetical protein